ncbi:hypothetical protein ACQJ1W_18610, partial [Klebsiella pneumoniae]
RKRAYCLKIQPATGSFARNLIYSTKPRDDLKATGINTKHFTRWLQKLIDDGLVIQDADLLTVKSLREVGN